MIICKLVGSLLLIIHLIAATEIKEVDLTQHFILTFTNMTNLISRKLALKSYQTVITYDQSLTLTETMELSDIYRDYVQQNMLIFVQNDLQKAMYSGDGDYYVWNQTINVWSNASGHILHSDQEAESANIDKLYELMETTVFNFEHDSILKKRFSFAGIGKAKAPNTLDDGLRQSLDDSQHYFDAAQQADELPVFPSSRPNGMWTFNRNPSTDEFFDAVQDLEIPPKPSGAIPRPSGAIPKPSGAIPKPSGAIPKPNNAVPKPINAVPINPVKTKRIIWRKYLRYKIRQSKALMLKLSKIRHIPGSILESLKIAWELLKIPIIRQFVRAYIRRYYQKYFSFSRSTRKAAAEDLEALHRLKEYGLQLVERLGY